MDNETINDIDHEDINDELLCPICKDYNLQPRIYDCGHSICEKCMAKKDTVDKKKILNVFTIDNYVCPLCRSYTIKPWFMRPVNHALVELLSIDDKYKQERDAYVDGGMSAYDKMIYNPPEDLDLSKVCEDSRIAMANNLYNDILPIMFEASLQGKAYITIPMPMAKNVRMVGDLISKRLFIKHNIYRMICNFRECTIELVKSHENEGLRNEYNNQSYINPRMQTITHSESVPNI